VKQAGFSGRYVLVVIGLCFAGLVGVVLVEGLFFRFGIIATIVVVAGIFLLWAWHHDRKVVEQARRDYS
jgi:undecaprenyl pyrophosphate phosphatase UppP